MYVQKLILEIFRTFSTNNDIKTVRSNLDKHDRSANLISDGVKFVNKKDGCDYLGQSINEKIRSEE